MNIEGGDMETDSQSSAPAAPKSSAARVRRFHERKRASGHQRGSFYLSQREVECLNELVRQFGWSRSTVIGRAIEARLEAR
jgi:hypothetical protein